MMGRSHKEKRSSYHPERRGCDMMEFIGLKNVGEKLESRVSRFVDIYLSNATMIVLHGQGGGGRMRRSQKKIMKCRSCTNDISDFLKDPQTLVPERSLTPIHKSLLVSTLKNFAGILSKTQHGHHVIMHCLRKFSNDLTKDLVEEIVVNTVDLAANKSGCCVLQHCFEHVREGEQKRRLIAEILANDLILSGDSFGSHKEKRSSYHPERRGCDMMEFIGLKNVGEKLESRVSRFVDIYLLNATMIVLHGQGGGGQTLQSRKKS